MKTQLALSLAVVAIFFSAIALHAEPAEAPADETQLHKLILQVQEKIKAGKETEADFATEFKAFDSLAESAKTNQDEAAQIIYMKGMLYVEVLKDATKGAEIFRQLKAAYPDTKYGKGAVKVLAALEKQAAAEKIQAGLTVGAAFPDFSEKDLSGQPLSVGALKGKVVLVDFWATWCPPCRAELPNVIATYKKHHADGFEVIGISLDSEREKLDDFLKQQDGMTWPQYFDGEGWSNKLAAKYGVQSIPFAVLIGPDGKIIGKDLRGEDLENAVSEALKKK